MAELINCPACGNQVSNQAPSCPNCGNPIATETTGVQSIQATGKSLKLQQLLSSVTTIIGLFMVFGGMPSDGGEPSGGFAVGVILLLGGFVWFAYARFMTWWRHG
ncbi:MAG TPA: zinc ribbon domain-containing protein [Gammaproteobacteria bacterium]|nr:zinc ribbon domain-containing protein [Gammaproteobacteria bacterium]